MTNEETIYLSQSHSRRQRATMWAGAALLIGAGIYLSSIRYLGAEWVSRAGCLVVVLGIWSGLGGIFQERVLVGRVEFKRRVAVARATRKLRRLGVAQDKIDQQMADIHAEYDLRIDKVSDHLRLSVGILEVSLLVTGTLLWGFGDLLPIP